MSQYDYIAARSLDAMDMPFYALIMAAMRKADTNNFSKLIRVYPDVWSELNARYHAPNGKLASDMRALNERNNDNA